MWAIIGLAVPALLLVRAIGAESMARGAGNMAAS